MKTRFLPGILAIVATGIVACGDDGSSVSSNYNNGDPGSEAGKTSSSSSSWTLSSSNSRVPRRYRSGGFGTG